jgi:prepilin-type N-terminal cleavage/methylation domain-containing protein
MPTANRQLSKRPAGFTLVELMVSIALVLIIILGVNAVFKMASDTINVGMALSAADRENRAVQSVVNSDFQTGVFTDGPMLLIRGERVAAFRNAADEAADRDGNPLTIDLDNNNREGEPNVRGERISPAEVNTRNHRIDRVSFFANHLFRRQTGTDSGNVSQYVDDGASNEAYIWYGHLDQPDFSTQITAGRFEHVSPNDPSVTDKAKKINNYYATDWILGRSVMLVRETPVVPGQLNPPNYFDYDPAARLSPLSSKSRARDADAQGVRALVPWSRYDLAQTSINTFRQTLLADIFSNGQDIDSADTWYEILAGEWGHPTNARFQGYPYPDRPLSGYGVARTVPVFVPGCTQFIVEYAGDYLGQNADTQSAQQGQILGTYLDGPNGIDGQVDFVVVQDKPHPNLPAVPVRRIRWYGFPRNTDTFNDLTGPTIAGPLGAGNNHNALRDVVPLRDVLMAAGATIGPDFFEHFERMPPVGNYAAPQGGLDADPRRVRYYAAWGPADLARGSRTRPKMIRITMTIDDPNGRLSDGQTYEYVMDLP